MLGTHICPQPNMGPGGIRFVAKQDVGRSESGERLVTPASSAALAKTAVSVTRPAAFAVGNFSLSGKYFPVFEPGTILMTNLYARYSCWLYELAEAWFTGGALESCFVDWRCSESRRAGHAGTA